MAELTKRKPNRLNQYDYSTPGAYFITVCTKNKEKILSNVGEGLAPPAPHLSVYGKIAEQQLLNLEKRYPNVILDKYVIMPNHIHMILVLKETAGGASPSPTKIVRFSVVRWYAFVFGRSKPLPYNIGYNLYV